MARRQGPHKGALQKLRVADIWELGYWPDCQVEGTHGRERRLQSLYYQERKAIGAQWGQSSLPDLSSRFMQMS